MFRAIHRPSVQVVDMKVCRDRVILITILVLLHFGLIKNTKVKYKSISNILNLLSVPESVPHTEPVLASFVVDSLSNCKF